MYENDVDSDGQSPEIGDSLGRRLCPNCKAVVDVISDIDRAENICPNCGNVLGRSFGTDSESDVRKEGYHTTDKGTTWSLDKDAMNNRLPPSVKGSFKRLAILQSRAKFASMNRTDSNAVSLLRKIKEELSLHDKIVEFTEYFYHQARKKKIRHSSREIIAAAVFMASKSTRNEISLTLISKATSINEKIIKKVYRLCIQENIWTLEKTDHRTEFDKFLVEYATDCEIWNKIKIEVDSERIMNVVETIRQGKDPRTVAAAVVAYLGEKVLGKVALQLSEEIANAHNLSSKAINNQIRDLRKSMG